MFLIGGWLGSAWLTGNQDYVSNILGKQVAGRASQSFAQKQPFYFYMLVLPVLLMPWTVFLPRGISWFNRGVEKLPRLFLYYWIILGMLILSLISGKLFIYLLPLMPPFAVLIGWFLANINEIAAGRPRFWLEFSVPFGALHVLGWVAGYFSGEDERLTFLLPAGMVMVLVSLGWLAALALREGRVHFNTTVWGLFLSSWLMNILMFMYIAVQINPLFSSRPVSRSLAAHSERGLTLSSTGVGRGIFTFYAGRLIPDLTREEALSYLAASSSNGLVTKTRAYRRMEGELPANTRVVETYRVAEHDYVLLVADPRGTTPLPRENVSEASGQAGQKPNPTPQTSETAGENEEPGS